MPDEPGRDELIDARAAGAQLLNSLETAATAIARLMEDRVRHITALRSILRMTETGIAAKGGIDVYRVALEALTAEPDMSWWPERTRRA